MQGISTMLQANTQESLLCDKQHQLTLSSEINIPFCVEMLLDTFHRMTDIANRSESLIQLPEVY